MQANENHAGLCGKRILVVEDDPVVAVDYYFELKGAGATETCEISIRAALAYLACHDVDAAIVDYHLPDGSCVPVLERLAARGIPYVVVSGDMFDIRGVPVGARILPKPVPSKHVCDALSEVLAD